MVALSLPTFLFGLIAIFIFSQQLRWLPAGGMQTLGSSGGVVLDGNLKLLALHHAREPARGWNEGILLNRIVVAIRDSRVLDTMQAMQRSLPESLLPLAALLHFSWQNQ